MPSERNLRRLAILMGTVIGLGLALPEDVRGDHFHHDERGHEDRDDDGNELPTGAVEVAHGGEPTDDPDAEREEREKRDLQAQEDMRDAAVFTVRLTIAGLVLGLIGTLYLVRTFDETRRVTVETARIGEAQLRSYLSVADLTLEATRVGGVFNLSLVLRNSGQSPARRLAVEGELIASFRYEDGRSDPDLVVAPLLRRIAPTDLPVGEREVVNGHFVSNEAWFQVVGEDGGYGDRALASLIANVTVMAEDVFGHGQGLCFAASFDAPLNGAGYGVHPLRLTEPVRGWDGSRNGQKKNT